MDLLMNHEKEYITKRNGTETFVTKPHETDARVFEVGGIGNESSVNEKFVWGGYEAAVDSAKKYLVEPVPDPMADKGRWRLTWM